MGRSHLNVSSFPSMAEVRHNGDQPQAEIKNLNAPNLPSPIFVSGGSLGKGSSSSTRTRKPPQAKDINPTTQAKPVSRTTLQVETCACGSAASSSDYPRTASRPPRYCDIARGSDVRVCDPPMIGQEDASGTVGEMPGTRGQMWDFLIVLVTSECLERLTGKTKILGALGISDWRCLVAGEELLEI